MSIEVKIPTATEGVFITEEGHKATEKVNLVISGVMEHLSNETPNFIVVVDGVINSLVNLSLNSGVSKQKLMRDIGKIFDANQKKRQDLEAAEKREPVQNSSN